MSKSPQENIILSLETVTRSASVAVLQGETVCSSFIGKETPSQSTKLLINIRKVLAGANLELNDISFLAAAVGPGSFTGLRIGLSTAKALCTALKIPAIGVSTLEAVAKSAAQNGFNAVIFPAGRGEVYSQAFFKEQNGEIRSINKISCHSLDKLVSEMSVQEDLHWLAPLELQEAISGLIDKNKSTIHSMPENLAIAVGQIANLRCRDRESFNKGLTAIYGRGADIGISKK